MLFARWLYLVQMFNFSTILALLTTTVYMCHPSPSLNKTAQNCPYRIQFILMEAPPNIPNPSHPMNTFAFSRICCNTLRTNTHFPKPKNGTLISQGTVFLRYAYATAAKPQRYAVSPTPSVQPHLTGQELL